MKGQPWIVGDSWSTQHNQLFSVVKVHTDGCAVVEMTRPYRKKFLIQHPVPIEWKLLYRKEEYKDIGNIQGQSI